MPSQNTILNLHINVQTPYKIIFGFCIIYILIIINASIINIQSFNRQTVCPLETKVLNKAAAHIWCAVVVSQRLAGQRRG